MCPSVPEDPALLFSGGSAAGPYSWKVVCPMVARVKDALQFLFSGCPDARELGCVLLQAAGTADITAL